jgi:hypothetical protein
MIMPRKMECAVGERRTACRFMARKPKGKRPLGRPKLVCMDNIKIDPAELG